MRKLLTICAILLSLSASAQWQLTGSKVRYVNGIGIPTKDTAAGVGADSSQILIRPADSSLYVKYKRTWMRVGGGGGSIAGSGTTNYIPKFTSSTAIGNSQIFDDGSFVGIGTILPGYKLDIRGSSGVGLQIFETSTGNNNRLRITQEGNEARFQNTFSTGFGRFTWLAGAAERMRIDTSGNVGIGTTSPTAKLHIKGSSNYDGIILIDNSTTTGGGILRILQNSVQSGFISVVGSVVGSSDRNLGYYAETGLGHVFYSNGANERMRITSDGNVGIGTASPGARLQVGGNTSASQIRVYGGNAGTSSPELQLYGASSDNNWTLRGNHNTDFSIGQGTFGNYGTQLFTLTAGGNVGIGTASPGSRLDVSGTATATNLSVTTNATVGGTLNVNGTTTLGTTNTGAINASSVNAPSGSGTFGNLYSNGIVQMLGVNVKYRNISATYTATTSDDYFINITSGTFTLNLPTAATPYGQVYVIKNSGTGTVTVDPNGTQTIDGATTFTMNVQNGSITIIGDGTNWKIVSKYL